MKSFRSFLNDEKAVKKVLIFLVPFLLAMLVFAGIKFGSYIKNYEPATEPVQDEITEPTTKLDTSYEDMLYHTFTVRLPYEFKPFECGRDDYQSYTANTGKGYFLTRIISNVLVYASEDESKELFRFPTFARACAYIGNALYLSDYDAQALYRIIIDEDGNYDLDSFSLVAYLYAEPVFVEENKLVLLAGSAPNDYYVILDTLTGEWEETDAYNKELTEVPSGLISAEQAEEIALKEIQKSEYQDEISGYTFSLETDRETGSNLTHLIYKPDFSNTLGGNYQYENPPEYGWFVYTVADNDIFDYPQIIVCVNAQTGSVAHVRILLPD